MITGAIRGTSSEKLFQELGLESLKWRRWLRKLFLFYKIFHEKSPWYLFQLIHPNNNVYATRHSQSNKSSSFKTRHFSKDPFFPEVIFPVFYWIQYRYSMQGWLLLTFFICLHNQLRSLNSIIVQVSEKRVHQIESKNEWLLLSGPFTAKLELAFVLTFENAFSESFHFKANRKRIGFSKKPY